MNAPLRRVGILMVILFGLLFANLNWVQAYKADEYRNSPYNAGRVQFDEYQRERGLVLVGRDGTPAAVSVETDGRLTYLRTYPDERRWAHVVGYKPVNLAATGIEQYENDFLAGTGDRFFVDRMRDLFTGGQTAGGTVQTTLSRGAQQAAYEQLRDNRVGADRGAVVAIDPRTGGLQALVSLPSFDPNPLASHDLAAAQAAYDELDQDPARPLANRALSERFEPGSVFKVITSAAALNSGYQADSSLQGGPFYTAPTAGSAIGNAPGVSCPGSISLEQALVVSCNTAFSWVAAEELGGDALAEMAQAFGFGDDELRVGRLDGDGTPVAESTTGELRRADGQDDPPTVALSAIGQASVQMTPLQGALLAATVANDGSQMAPYVVEQLQDAQLRPVYQASPEQLRQPVSPAVAGELRQMMVGAVERGTGVNAQIPGYQVGGKTGTAETGGDADANHGWFVGFVLDDGEPVSAVAVLLQNAGSGGSAEAARIAGQVMTAALDDRRGDS